MISQVRKYIATTAAEIAYSLVLREREMKFSKFYKYADIFSNRSARHFTSPQVDTLLDGFTRRVPTTRVIELLLETLQMNTSYVDSIPAVAIDASSRHTTGSPILPLLALIRTRLPIASMG